MSVLLAAVCAGADAAEPEALLRARALYNQRRFDEAIEAAAQARPFPETRHPAALLQGRAGLERFRRTDDPSDLVNAREALRSVEARQLGARDRIDLEIGLAEALYLDGAPRAAAEMFGSVLDRARDLTPTARDELLDWWATSVDRAAQSRPTEERAAEYEEIAREMREELKQEPASATASYWLVVAARAIGDFDLAWDHAVAGWVRAQLNRERGAMLRADLDRLVGQALIPERAKKLAAESREVEADQAAAGLAAEWEQVKARWTGSAPVRPSRPSSSSPSPRPR